MVKRNIITAAKSRNVIFAKSITIFLYKLDHIITIQIYLNLFITKEKLGLIFCQIFEFCINSSNSTLTVPVGPCLCLPKMISASPLTSFILDCHSACSIEPNLGCFLSQ